MIVIYYFAVAFFEYWYYLRGFNKTFWEYFLLKGQNKNLKILDGMLSIPTLSFDLKIEMIHYFISYDVVGIRSMGFLIDAPIISTVL